jgi:hypothetical protein
MLISKKKEKKRKKEKERKRKGVKFTFSKRINVKLLNRKEQETMVIIKRK